MPLSVGELVAYLRLEGASNFDRSITSAQRSLDMTGASARKMGASVEESEVALRGAGREADRVSASSGKLRAAQLSVVAAQERYNALLAEGGASAGKLATAEASLIRANERVAASSRSAGAAVATAGKGASTSGMGTMVKQLAGFALVLGAIHAGKEAVDYQTQITRLGTAAGESQKNLQMMSDGILKISTATGTNLKKVGDAAYYVESAGFHGAAALKVLSAAAEGAKVEGADTAKVADALTTALTDMGTKAGDPATVMSKLVATVAHGKMTMDDLAGSLHSVLPNAAAVGLSFEQVAGALSTMTAQGIGAEQATQNLNHVILALKAPTGVMTSAMAAVHISSTQVSRDLGKVGLTGTLQELSTAITRQMGPSGLLVTNALNTSSIAAGKVTKAYASMTPEMKKYADEVVKGGHATVTANQLGQGFDLAQKAQIQQYVKLYKSANGFSDLLKAKSPEALAYVAAMEKMTGGITGVQVALHLTGDHLSTFKANVAEVGAATSAAGGHVADFAVKQQTLGQKMDLLKTSVSNAAVGFGLDLIPAMTSATSFLLKHQHAVEVVIGSLVALKVAIFAVETAQRAWAAGAALVQGAMTAISAASRVAGAAVAAGLGPIGVTVGAVALGLGLAAKSLGLFGHSAKQQVKPVQDLTDAILADGDAVGKLTQANMNQKLSQDGAYEAGKRLGLSQSTVLAATLGNAHAMNVVAAATQRATDQYRAATTATGANSGSLHAQQQALGNATQAQKDAAAAANTLAGILPAQAAGLGASQTAADDSAKAMSGLASAERAVPKSVVTMVTVAGAVAARDVIRSVVEYANNQSAVIHVTTVNTTTGAVSGGRQVANAAGGSIPEGYSTINEQGWELVHKRGSDVQVFSHADSKKMLPQGPSVPAFASGTATARVVGAKPSPVVVPLVISTGNANGIASYIKGQIPSARLASGLLAAAVTDAFAVSGLQKKIAAVRADLAATRQSALSLSSGVAGTLSGAVDPSQYGDVAQLIATYQNRTGVNNRFTAQETKLSKEGLSKGLLAELVAKGDSAGLAALASAPKSQVTQVNRAYAGFGASASRGGSVAASDVFGSRISNESAQVAAIAKQSAATEKAMVRAVGQLARLLDRPIKVSVGGKEFAHAVIESGAVKGVMDDLNHVLTTHGI